MCIDRRKAARVRDSKGRFTSQKQAQPQQKRSKLHPQRLQELKERSKKRPTSDADFADILDILFKNPL